MTEFGPGLAAISVQIEPGAAFGYPDPREVLIEAPVRIRPGLYDIDFIGGFTFMGGRQTSCDMSVRSVAFVRSLTTSWQV